MLVIDFTINVKVHKNLYSFSILKLSFQVNYPDSLFEGSSKFCLTKISLTN